jgi:hypothetical protein
MIRDHDDAVCTFVRTTTTPTYVAKMLDQYWGEVSRQVAGLIGGAAACRLADHLLRDPVLMALYRKSEQGRIDCIIYLQRTGNL